MMADLSITNTNNKTSLLKVPFIFILVLLFTCTFLRISLLVLYPFLAALVFIAFRLRFTRHTVDLLMLVGVGWLLSLYNGFFPKYNLLSLFYMLPFLVLLFAMPGSSNVNEKNRLHLFFYAFSIIILANDLLGILQVIFMKESDDNFTGLYSSFSLAMNGLAVLNSLLFIYYFFSFLSYKKTWYLIAGAFFLVCSILGFYGGGLMVLVIALVITFFNATFSSMIKTLLVSIVSLVVIYYALVIIKPKVLEYNVTNLKRAWHFNDAMGARKVISFYNYFQAYPPHTRDFLFGSGPGTFNSRSAFIVGSPYFFTHLPAIKSDKKPPYFRDYAYPLWNNTNTSMALYQDGFRNQPFSSLLAFLGEYGLIFTFFFALYLYKYYKKVVPGKPAGNMPPQYYLYTRLFKCFLVVLLLLMVIDNYLEYPEITLLITVILKLLQVEIKKIQTYSASLN